MAQTKEEKEKTNLLVCQNCNKPKTDPKWIKTFYCSLQCWEEAWKKKQGLYQKPYWEREIDPKYARKGRKIKIPSRKI